MIRKMILGLVVFTLLSVSVFGGIHYEISSGYFGSKSLYNDDTLNMTGGWGEDISANGTSVATIWNTDSQGIIDISAGSSSTLNIHGGTFGEIELTNFNFATIKGGNIGTLISAQDVHEDAPSFAVIPRTYLYASEYSYDDVSMILTGKWLKDNASFSIQLEDKYGISTYENLMFVPEPMSIMLIGLGGVFLRKR